MIYADNETLKRTSLVSSPSTLRATSGEEFALDSCGRWILGIPRHHISFLSRTDEYKLFMQSFDLLESAYRRVISTPPPPTAMLSSSQTSASAASFAPPPPPPLLESDDAESSSSSRQTDDSEKFPCDKIRSVQSAPIQAAAEASRRQSFVQCSKDAGCSKCFKVRGSLSVSKEENLLQQFLKADDVLIRIFEFLESKSLIQSSKVCSRFRVVSEQSARQRTFRLARERQLANAMQLLRVQEQLNGVAWSGGDHDIRTGNNRLHVRVPILLLGRVVVVRDAGDPDFNGIYSCTDCSSNGYVFTKPIQQSPGSRRSASNEEEEGQDGEQNRTHAETLQQRQPPQHVLPDAFLRAVFGIHPHGQHGPNTQIPAAGNRNQRQEETPLSENHTGRPTNMIRDELSKENKRPLRCIISKKWSGEHLLWYMGKEEVDSDDGGSGNDRRGPKLKYSYWAPLAVGPIPTDIDSYPSTSSYLLSRGQHWRPLSNIQTRNAAPPTVEVLD